MKYTYNGEEIGDQTLYVIQQGSTASVVTGSSHQGGVMSTYTAEILDPGGYWDITTTGLHFGVAGGTVFTWTEPEGASGAEDRDFTFKFTLFERDQGRNVFEKGSINLNVHIGYAETQIKIAGQLDFHPSNVNVTPPPAKVQYDNTAVVGQHVEAKIAYDPVFTRATNDTGTWSVGGGGYVKDYVTNNNEGRIVNHTDADKKADTFDYYHTTKTSAKGSVSKTITLLDPHGDEHGVGTTASYYLEKVTLVPIEKESGEPYFVFVDFIFSSFLA